MAGNLIEKSLKRYLKRKVKITLGLITAFLITGAVSFSAEQTRIEIGYDNGIKIYEVILDESGKEKERTEIKDESYGKIDSINNKWINDKEINKEIFINKEILGSGIVLNIENNGKISVDDGNGIAITLMPDESFSGEIGDIINNGIISGKIEKEETMYDSVNAGNGIGIFNYANKEIKLNNIVNNGIILGQAGKENEFYEGWLAGNGIGISIFAGGSIVLKKIENNGIIKSTVLNIESSQNAGNGIGLFLWEDAPTSIIINDIINNGTIAGSINNTSDIVFLQNTGNGIGTYDYTGHITLKNIVNKGIVSGYAEKGTQVPDELSNLSNGIGIYALNETKISSLLNKGIINGYAKMNTQITGLMANIGNGIGIYQRSMGVLTVDDIINNNGAISGKFIGTMEKNSNGGNGLSFYNTYEGRIIINNNIFNNGTITGYLDGTADSESSSGNGLSFYNSIELSDFFDEDIEGKLELKKIFNTGMTKGYVFGDIKNNSSGGNGLSIYNTIFDERDDSPENKTKKTEAFINFNDDIVNNGSLIGILVGTATNNSSGGNGLGIYNGSNYNSGTKKSNEKISLKNISNKGVMSGYINDSTRTSTGNFGNGLSIYNNTNANNTDFVRTITLNKLTNTGLIIGNEHGIYLKDVTTNNGKYNNYGVVGGKTAVDINGNDGISENSGLYLTFNDNHEVTAIERAENGEAATENFYIVNAVKENENSTKTIFSSEINGKSNHILNGVNNTLTVNQDTTLNNSIINAYENAVKIENGSFTGENIIINGGGLRIKDEDGNNIEQNIAVTGLGGADVFTLKGNSVLNGDIVMGSGIDTLSFENDTKVNGNVNGEEGNDIFTFKDNSVLNGDVAMGSGIDTLSFENDTKVNGNVNGEEGNDIFTFKDNSVLNGDVAMGEGDDTVSFDSKVQINGNLDGGTNTDADTKDTLNLGINGASDRGTLNKTFDNSLRIYNEIKGFENINIKDNVTVFETAKIKDAETLTIEKGNQLNLRIDGTKKDSEGKITGHALYKNNSNLTITGTTDDSTDDTITENENADKYNKAGILNLVTSGLGKGAVIDFTGITFDTDTSDEEGKGVWVKTDNLLDNVVINNDETITIDGEKDIFKIIAKAGGSSDTSGKLYEKLNDIYKGAYSSGDENFIELKNIITNTGIKGDGDYTEVTEEQQLKTLLAYLKEIYTNSPYSFTSDASRKSMGMFRDAVRENNFKALEDEWIIYGGFTHIDGNREQTYYGRNYHKFDTGSYDNNADVKMTGAYAQAEYGLDNTLSAGILFGGNKSDIEVSNSKADGNSMYLGGYIKKDIKDFRITAGAGMQYSEYDAERNMSNRKYDDKYSDNAFDIYVNGKYFYEISDSLYFEPYGQLAYTYVDQEGINENDGALSLNIKDKDFTFIEGTIGADLRKEIIKNDIKHNFKGGISYTRLLDGYKEDNLTADFGGNSFDILVPHKTPDELRIGVRYELERTDGLMFSVNADYLISTDSKDNGHKNENKNEWRIGAGFGYRFNSQFFGE